MDDNDGDSHDDIEESFDDDDDERDLNFVIDILGECPLL